MPIQLPLWVEEVFPHQLTAIHEILTTFEQGYQVAVLDAPTGSGKTLIAELIRQSLNYRAIYLCSSIALQEQFIRDFDYAAFLMGRSNYATTDLARFPELNAGDCIKSYDDRSKKLHCRWCDPVTACPYERAKAHAIRSDLVCTNTAYFLHEANYVGSLPLSRQLIIVDEADLLEQSILSFVEVQIPERRAKDLGIEPPAKKTVESAWVDWAIYAEAHLAEVRKDARFQGTQIPAIRARKSLDNLIRNVGRLNDPISGLRQGGWVYTGYDRGDIAFKPVTVDHIAREYLWKHSPRWLLMSATTISFQVLMQSLGL